MPRISVLGKCSAIFQYFFNYKQKTNEVKQGLVNCKGYFIQPACTMLTSTCIDVLSQIDSSGGSLAADGESPGLPLRLLNCIRYARSAAFLPCFRFYASIVSAHLILPIVLARRTKITGPQVGAQ